MMYSPAAGVTASIGAARYTGEFIAGTQPNFSNVQRSLFHVPSWIVSSSSINSPVKTLAALLTSCACAVLRQCQ